MALVAFVAVETALMFFVDRPLAGLMWDLDGSHHRFIEMFRAYTDFGKSDWYLWPSGMGALLCCLFIRLTPGSFPKRALFSKMGAKLLFFFSCIALSGIFSDIIKPIVGRARPVLMMRDGTYGFSPFSFHATWNSMPSGHSTTAFALAAALTALVPKGRVFWFVIAIMLMISRVAVNAHFVSDTIAGAALGLVTVYLVQKWLRRYGKRLSRFDPFTTGQP